MTDYRSRVAALFKRLGVEAPQDAAFGLELRSPIDGQPLVTLVSTDVTMAGLAIERASARFPAWRDTPAPSRGAVVRGFAERVRRHKATLAELVTIEREVVQSAWGERR